jgi:hypothetical protein
MMIGRIVIIGIKQNIQLDILELHTNDREELPVDNPNSS